MKIGISTACFYPQYLEKTIEMIGKSGIKDMEIFFNTESETADEFVNLIKDMVNFYDLNVVSVHPYSSSFEPFLLFTDYERRFQDGLKLYSRYFEIMNKLDAKYLVLHGDKQASMSSDDLYIDHFGRLKTQAEKYGVTLAQENVYLFRSGKIDFIQKLVDAFSDIALVFDNKQAIRCGVDPIEFLSRFGNNIKHVHLSDNDENSDCLPYGWGKLDFDLIFNELNKHSYNGAVMLELYRKNYQTHQNLYDCVNWLKSQICCEK